jgi:hypothetical protein
MATETAKAEAWKTATTDRGLSTAAQNKAKKSLQEAVGQGRRFAPPHPSAAPPRWALPGLAGSLPCRTDKHHSNFVPAASCKHEQTSWS